MPGGSVREGRKSTNLNRQSRDLRKSFTSQRSVSKSFRGSRLSSEERKSKEVPNLARQIAAEISDDDTDSGSRSPKTPKSDNGNTNNSNRTGV